MTGINSGISALALQGQAEAREQRLEQQAKELELQKDVSRLQARRKQTQVNERLNETLANQKAALSGAGIDVGSEISKEDAEQAIDKARRAKQTIGSNLARQRIQLETKQNLLESRAGFAEDKAQTRQLSETFQGFANLFKSKIKSDRAEERQEKLMNLQEDIAEEKIERRTEKEFEKIQRERMRLGIGPQMRPIN